VLPAVTWHSIKSVLNASLRGFGVKRTLYYRVPEMPDNFINEITFESKVEKFINTGRCIAISIKNLF
jgi:hypothetical protein